MWEFYKPETKKRVKQPRAQIVVSGKQCTLLLNELICKELGINTIVKNVLFRIDRTRNVIGLTFHNKTQEGGFRLGRRKALDTSAIRTVNVAKLLYDVLPTGLENGTYNLTYTREKNILVLSLDNLVKSDED